MGSHRWVVVTFHHSNTFRIHRSLVPAWRWMKVLPMFQLWCCCLLQVFFILKKTWPSQSKHQQDFHPTSSCYQRTVYPTCFSELGSPHFSNTYVHTHLPPTTFVRLYTDFTDCRVISSSLLCQAYHQVVCSLRRESLQGAKRLELKDVTSGKITVVPLHSPVEVREVVMKKERDSYPFEVRTTRVDLLSQIWSLLQTVVCSLPMW